MACEYCCGADQLFDLKGAKKELKKYKKKGPGKPTKKLIELLFRNGVENQTLLDIGGGIGANQWAFLENGGKNTMDVDASGGYISVAKSYAKDQGYEEMVDFKKGDFVDYAEEISSADYVSLDKVICCYPDYESLLGAALNKCKISIGLVYPYGGPVAKLFGKLEMIYFWIKKISFGTYIHDPKEVEQFIKNHGFEVVEKTKSFPWHIQVYRRVNPA